MNLVKTTFDFPAENNTVDAVRYWVNLSARFKHADLCCQVMAGFALIELRNTHAKKGGRPRKTPVNIGSSQNSPNNSGSFGCEELVKQTGISDDTARNWIKMASGVRSKWKHLPIRDRLRELLSTPVSQWNDDDASLISKAVKRITDGKTQLEFMFDLGLAAKPGKPGRKPGDGGRPGPATPAEALAYHLKTCRDDMLSVIAALDLLRDRFTITGQEPNPETYEADQVRLQALLSVCERQTKALHAWLDTPRAKRDAALAEKIHTLF